MQNKDKNTDFVSSVITTTAQTMLYWLNIFKLKLDFTAFFRLLFLMLLFQFIFIFCMVYVDVISSFSFVVSYKEKEEYLIIITLSICIAYYTIMQVFQQNRQDKVTVTQTDKWK